MRKKKKDETVEGKVLEIGKVTMESPKEKLYLALFRGILIFLAVYGSIGTYLSGFMVPYDENLVVVTLGIISLYMGLIYYNKWTENIGYIVLLTVFSLSAFYMETYIKSGFAAIMNETTDVLSQIYDLPAIRMFQEILDDRYTAITICVIFIGIFIGILFNIIIARYMNFWGTLAMIMPSVGITFFFNRNVEKKYIFMVIMVVVAVAILKREENYKSRTGGLLSSIRKKQKNKIKLRIGKGSIFIQVGLLLSVIMGLFFGMAQLVYPQDRFQTPSEWQGFRESSNDTIRTILMVGFPSFLTGQYGRGGISGGNLSGAVSVTPDYMTDLTVTFVPYTRETMYLRAFTGVDYEGKKWTCMVNGEYPFYDIPAEKIHNLQSNLLKKAYENQENSHLIQTKMRIKNDGASEEYGYFPYYSIMEEGKQYYFDGQESVLGSFRKGDSYTLTYYPYCEGIEVSGEEGRLEARYASYAAENYMGIPDKNKQLLSDICDSIGREGSEQDKIQRVVQYLETECSYSKKPGAVPRGEDFVNYFLTKKRRGFCMHFASAGTLLLREMGIPARYVEGYAIPYSDVLNGEILDDQKYEDWFSGENPLGKTAVMEVEVDDSLAHAWVEVYQKGFGWKVVDVTPAYYGDADDEGFWDDLGDAFRLEENNETANPLQVRGIANGIKTAAIIVCILLITFLGGRVFYRIVWKDMLKSIAYRKFQKRGQYNKCITYEYKDFCQRLAYVMEQEEMTAKEPKELFFILQQEEILKEDIDQTVLEKMIELVEKALYSGHMLQKGEYEWCRAVMKKMMKSFRKMSWGRNRKEQEKL